jgi:hypothetical protein
VNYFIIEVKMMKKFFEDIPTYKWEELDGKTLVMKVVSYGAYTVLFGKDDKTGELFAIADKLIR